VDSAWEQKKLEARKMLACTCAAGTGEKAAASQPPVLSVANGPLHP